ncbi:hypothetical protein [Cellulosimicrobium arenosum]|uniref:Lipoprotein n=1 Tax=Cellulosimicrobium arenosum TaxID=2708133 RepID=A0A927G9F7_9MICO|nr:hypothetical protein [Cellulosimicrobium arenosum]MBD8078897.1 hypothetical protein [Cellulosimicrobium arenosum]
MRTRFATTRTLAALATASVLTLGLAACSSDEPSDDATATTTAEDATPSEEDSDPAAEEQETTGTDGTDGTDGTEESAEGASSDVCGAIDEISSMGSIDPSDPEAAATAFQDVTTAFEAAEPPAELSSDWDYLTESFSTFNDEFQAAAGDPENADTDGLTDAMGELSSEEFTSALTNVATYGGQNC